MIKGQDYDGPVATSPVMQNEELCKSSLLKTEGKDL